MTIDLFHSIHSFHTCFVCIFCSFFLQKHDFSESTFYLSLMSKVYLRINVIEVDIILVSLVHRRRSGGQFGKNGPLKSHKNHFDWLFILHLRTISLSYIIWIQQSHKWQFIVPRVLFEGWSVSDFNSLFMSKEAVYGLINFIVDFIDDNGFDGLVLEVWSQFGQHYRQ